MILTVETLRDTGDRLKNISIKGDIAKIASLGEFGSHMKSSEP